MSKFYFKKTDLENPKMSTGKGSSYAPSIADMLAEPNSWPGVEADYIVLDFDETAEGAVDDIYRYGATATDNGDGSYTLEAKSEPAAVKAKKLVIATDAEDTVVPNGIPDIVANGTDSCTITAQLQEEDVAGEGNFVDKALADVVIATKTTGGKISAREITTDASGIASLTLTSNNDTIDVVVDLASDGYGDGSITIEFAPVS